MSQEYENTDDYRKVFVSRLPLKWKDDMLKQHFESCFGGVEVASINWDKENDVSLGYGFVTFLNEDGAKAALEQGSMHVQRKIIQIRPVSRKSDNGDASSGFDSGVCFLWQKKRCVKGDTCKFSHVGEGACITVAEPYQGLARRKCLSFKSKGKCSKGDACHFLHIGKEKGETGPGSEKKAVSSVDDSDQGLSSSSGETKQGSGDSSSENKNANVKDGKGETPQGICHSFKKKGKCRKGDKCKFSHSTPSTASSAENTTLSGKRKRIDGSLLVKNRKKLLALESQGECVAGDIDGGGVVSEGA